MVRRIAIKWTHHECALVLYTHEYIATLRQNESTLFEHLFVLNLKTAGHSLRCFIRKNLKCTLPTLYCNNMHLDNDVLQYAFAVYFLGPFLTIASLFLGGILDPVCRRDAGGQCSILCYLAASLSLAKPLMLPL